MIYCSSYLKASSQERSKHKGACHTTPQFVYIVPSHSLAHSERSATGKRNKVYKRTTWLGRNAIANNSPITLFLTSIEQQIGRGRERGRMLRPVLRATSATWNVQISNSQARSRGRLFSLVAGLYIETLPGKKN